MRLLEELLGDLAEVVDEADDGVLLQWVFNAVRFQFHISNIRGRSKERFQDHSNSVVDRVVS